MVCRFVSTGTIYLTGNTTHDRPTEGNPFVRRREARNNVEAEMTNSSAYLDKILTFVSYDAAASEILDHFASVKQNTECLFARTSKIWGARPFLSTLSLEDNVFRSIPMFIKFCNVGQSLYLDGFLFEIPHQEFGQSPESFGRGVRRLMKCLSDHDPAKRKCMDRSYIDKRGWYFEFDKISIFVTTFAPCYPSCHSRYSFGAQGCFILFQPEFSFAAHDIGPDTPDTNWECPVTVRDKIRVAYKDAGRQYAIRDTVYYPPAHDIVKPLGIHDPPVEWWKEM